MSMLIAGLIVFVGVHLVPVVQPLRTGLIANLGEKKYKALFAITSFIGLGLIIWGFSRAEFEPIYQPSHWGRLLAFALVPISIILFAAANMPTFIRYFVRHPMLIGLLLWAVSHLVANGDQRSVLLFGTLGAYAVVAIISAVTRSGASSEGKEPRLVMDGVAVVAGVVVAGLIVKFHGALFGMPLM